MYGSSAGNSAASADRTTGPATGRRKLLNKRRGVSPQAILFSVLLCGGAFAYALSASDTKLNAEPAPSVVRADAGAESATNPAVTAAPQMAETAPQEAAAPARPAAPLRPRLQTEARITPIDTGDPRWAQDVEPVESGFDWQGKLALSAEGDDIVTVDPPTHKRNPLIEQAIQASELAYAEPAPSPKRKIAVNFPEVGLVDARTRSAVNMRSAGKKSASVITVVPRGAAVRVAQDCKHWCPTVYEDKRGFVYKTYITLVDLGSTASVQSQQETGQPARTEKNEKQEMRAEDYMQWQKR